MRLAADGDCDLAISKAQKYKELSELHRKTISTLVNEVVLRDSKVKELSEELAEKEVIE